MILEFFKAAANLKNVSRQGWIDRVSIEHPESVADHTYSMAIMGMIMSDLGSLNSEKVIRMVLLHDLAESKIGDYTPGQISKEEKKSVENGAFYNIAENLPDSIKTPYLEIWKEYQEGITPESRMVHQIDRLEMALQAKLYQKRGHPHDMLESFFDYAETEIVDPKLKELFRNIVEDS